MLDKVTYQAVYDDSIIDALGYASLNGFAGVQVAVEAPHLSLSWLAATECDEIRRMTEAHDLSISVHAPDDVCSLYIFNLHESDRAYS